MTDEIRIRLPDGEAERLGYDSSAMQVLFSNPQMLVVEARAQGDGKRGTRPRMFADLKYLSVFDALLLAGANHASGTFVVHLADNITKKVYVKSGKVVFAESTINDDRLGESLVRSGKLSMDEMNAAAKLITPEYKLGKILVDKGYISPKELYLGVKRQVEEIVIGLVCANVGRMGFFEGFDKRSDIVALSLDTPTLLVNGLRRTPAWATVPDGTPDREIYLTLSTHPDTVGLNAEERRLLSLIGEGISLRHLVEVGGLGRLYTNFHIHRLLLRGVLNVRKVAPDDQPKVEQAKRRAIEVVLNSFQQTYSDVLTLLEANADGTKLKRSIDSFFDALPGAASNVLLGQKSMEPLDVEKLLAAVEAIDVRDRATAVEFTVAETLNYLVFESHELVDGQVAREVLSIVQRSLRK